MQKTVLHITGMDSTKYGGLEHYLVELTSYLREKQVNTVLQYETLPKSPTYLQDLKAQAATVRVLPIFGNVLRSALNIAGLVRTHRPFVIHTHFCKASVRLVTPIMGRALGVSRNVTSVHSFQNMERKSLKRFAFNFYDHVLPVSDAVRRDLLSGGVNTTVTTTHYLGLFGDRQRSRDLGLQVRRELGIDESAVVLACLAFDTPFKGLDILLDAFAQVVTDHPECRLVVIGVNPSRSALPSQAEKLGISKFVHWPGIRDDGWRLLNSADLYIQPSRTEGLGLSIMEAMALRLPVIATRCGGIPEAVVDGETGYLAEPGDRKSLVGVMKSAIDSRSQWNAFGEAGHARYSRLFRGEDSIRTLAEEYYKL